MYITIKSLWERHKNKLLIAKMTGHDWKTVAKRIKEIEAGKEFPTKKPHPRMLDPYQELVFCLRVERMVDSYRKVSINNLELKVPGAPLHERIQLRIVPDKESGVSEVRFWYKDEFLGSQKVKNSDLNLAQF